MMPARTTVNLCPRGAPRLKSEAQLERMRQACRLVVECLEQCGRALKPGLETRELDRLVERRIKSGGAAPAFKGYRGYPASVCVSVNEEVVHGIPGERAIRSGDLVSVDIGVKQSGWYGDGAFTFAVGGVSGAARRLRSVGRQALDLAVRAVRPGEKLSHVCFVIQEYVEGQGFAVVRDFVGHGIGQKMHEPPQVPNFIDASVVENDVTLRPGMVLAIEPMVNEGGTGVHVTDNAWTAVTDDGGLSVHFEHTVAVTADGAAVLTDWAGTMMAED